jgi:hypothetical protein
MSKRPRGTEGNAADVRTLEMMLDYAIVEGAELRLPLFVLLMRMARLELMTSIDGSGRMGERSRKVKVKDRASAAECRSFAEPILERWIGACGAALEASSFVPQDR